MPPMHEMEFMELPASPVVASEKELCERVVAEVQAYAPQLVTGGVPDVDRLSLELADLFFINGWSSALCPAACEYRRRRRTGRMAPDPGLLTIDRLRRLQDMAACLVGPGFVEGVDEIDGELVVYLHLSAQKAEFPATFDGCTLRVTHEPYPMDAASELQRYERDPRHRTA